MWIVYITAEHDDGDDDDESDEEDGNRVTSSGKNGMAPTKKVMSFLDSFCDVKLSSKSTSFSLRFRTSRILGVKHWISIHYSHLYVWFDEPVSELRSDLIPALIHPNPNTDWLLIYELFREQAAAAMSVGMGSFSDPADAQGLAHFLGS